MLPLAFVLSSCLLQAQSSISFEEADVLTAGLHDKKDWKELLSLGKSAIHSGHDSLNIRLRTADAAFMMGNYGEAFNQYKRVLKKQFFNAHANRQCYLLSKSYGRGETAGYYASRLTNAEKDAERLNPVKLTALELELSPKFIDTDLRGNALFRRAGFHARVGHRLTHEQSASYLVQNISEPILKGLVTDEKAIGIVQWSYYTKFTYSLTGSLAIKLAYQHQYTAFSNLIFHNNMSMIGLKWNGNYVDIQGDVMFCRIVDSATVQYNIRAGVYPLGNTRLYGMVRASRQKGKGRENYVANYIVGGKLTKKLGIEASAIFTGYLNFMSHDAVYLFNALDATNWKAGITLTYPVNKILLIFNVYREERQFYKADNPYHIYSLAGAAIYKF